METRAAIVIDALVTSFTAAGLTAWDGPVLTEDWSSAVYVGFDADPEGDGQAVGVTQEWAGLGQRKRNEELDVACAVVVTTGNADTAWKPARDAAFAILTTVGETLRADPSLGQTPTYFVAELQPGQYYQEPGPAGFQARITFTVHVKTRV